MKLFYDEACPIKSMFKIVVFNFQRRDGENRRGAKGDGRCGEWAIVFPDFGLPASVFYLRTPVFRLIFNQ